MSANVVNVVERCLCGRPITDGGWRRWGRTICTVCEDDAVGEEQHERAASGRDEEE